MGPVVTYWSGSAHDSVVQAELIAYIAKLAELNDARLRRRTMLRTDVHDAMTLPEASPVYLPPNISYCDQMLQGRIAIGRSMLILEQLSGLARESATMITCPIAWNAELPMASCAIYSRADEHHYAVRLPAFGVQGIVFRIYDPRHMYPDNDCMSFTFILAPNFPEIDGQIVQVHSRAQIATLDDDLLQHADWILETPSLNLRYFLEEWFDLLMAWIKIFFIPNLEYWRNAILNRFDEINDSIGRLIAAEGSDVAKQAVFEFILESFENEADQWDEEIAKLDRQNPDLEH